MRMDNKRRSIIIILGLSILLVFLGGFSFPWSDNDDIEKENKKLKTENHELKAENQELKEQLGEENMQHKVDNDRWQSYIPIAVITCLVSFVIGLLIGRKRYKNKAPITDEDAGRDK